MFPKDFETPKNLQVQSNKFGMKGFDEMMRILDIIQQRRLREFVYFC